MTRLQMTLPIALVGGGLVFGSLAVAQDNGGDAKLSKMLEGIELTSQQQEIADRVQSEGQADREALATAHDQMVEVFLTELERGEPDRARVHIEVAGFLAQLEESTYDSLNGVLDLYGALDAEQKEMFRMNVEDLHAQGEKFGPGGGGD
jgi:hypothetical protein